VDTCTQARFPFEWLPQSQSDSTPSAQIENHPMPRFAIVPENRDATVVVAVDDIEVSISIKVTVGGAKTHPKLIEPQAALTFRIAGSEITQAIFFPRGSDSPP